MSHKYPHNGFVKPGCTGIIADCTDKSPALLPWGAGQVCEWIRQNCPNIIVSDYEGAEIYRYYRVLDNDLDAARFHFREVSQEALDVGSIVHKAIEHYLLTGKEPLISNDQAVAGFLAFLEWESGHKLETISVEDKVYGDYWGGTLDWYGYLDGKLTVIDFKSSKALYPEYRYQIAAYRSTTQAQASAILRLDKETGYPEFKDYSKSYESDLAVFNAMVQLYMLRHPRIAKGAGWSNQTK